MASSGTTLANAASTILDCHQACLTLHICVAFEFTISTSVCRLVVTVTVKVTVTGTLHFKLICTCDSGLPCMTGTTTSTSITTTALSTTSVPLTTTTTAAPTTTTTTPAATTTTTTAAAPTTTTTTPAATTTTTTAAPTTTTTTPAATTTSTTTPAPTTTTTTPAATTTTTTAAPTTTTTTPAATTTTTTTAAPTTTTGCFEPKVCGFQLSPDMATTGTTLANAASTILDCHQACLSLHICVAFEFIISTSTCRLVVTVTVKVTVTGTLHFKLICTCDSGQPCTTTTALSTTSVPLTTTGAPTATTATPAATTTTTAAPTTTTTTPAATTTTTAAPTTTTTTPAATTTTTTAAPTTTTTTPAATTTTTTAAPTTTTTTPAATTTTTTAAPTTTTTTPAPTTTTTTPTSTTTCAACTCPTTLSTTPTPCSATPVVPAAPATLDCGEDVLAATTAGAGTTLMATFTTQPQCQDACHLDPRCYGFEWRTTPPQCFHADEALLKTNPLVSGAASVTFTTLKDCTLTSVLVSACGQTFRYTDCFFSVQIGTRAMNGYPVTAANIQQCSNLCLNAGRCKAFDWEGVCGVCYLHTALTFFPTVADSTFVYQKKVCSAPDVPGVQLMPDMVTPVNSVITWPAGWVVSPCTTIGTTDVFTNGVFRTNPDMASPNFPLMSFDECFNLCNSEPTCTAFDFVVGFRMCFTYLASSQCGTQVTLNTVVHLKRSECSPVSDPRGYPYCPCAVMAP